MLTEWRESASRHFPDLNTLMASGKEALGPAAGVAMVVFVVGLFVTRKRAPVAVAAVAMLAAVGVVNYLHPLLKWWPALERDPDRPLFSHFHGREFLLLFFVLAQVDGILTSSEGVPTWGKWRLRLGLGLLAAILIVPAGLHDSWPIWPKDYASWPHPFKAWAWPLAGFTLAVALGWAGSTKAAQQWPGPWVGLGLAASLFGASIVIIHGHYASMAEAVTLPAAALVGISLVALFAKVEVTGALPGLCVLLPACLLATATLADSEVPWYAFVLAGLPPITVGIMGLPSVAKMSGIGKHLLFWTLCLGPTIAALVIAMRVEELPTSSSNDEWSLISTRIPC
ncbi:MAG TPA: hypothetical protein VHR66_15115 [Gemmataceae bacterium]|jgi:hypothetical protein|nr:hypothetical protein [Gemmataceae bacterium]